MESSSWCSTEDADLKGRGTKWRIPQGSRVGTVSGRRKNKGRSGEDGDRIGPLGRVGRGRGHYYGLFTPGGLSWRKQETSVGVAGHSRPVYQ